MTTHCESPRTATSVETSEHAFDCGDIWCQSCSAQRAAKATARRSAARKGAKRKPVVPATPSYARDKPSGRGFLDEPTDD